MNRSFAESDTALFTPPPKPPRAAGRSTATAQSAPTTPQVQTTSVDESSSQSQELDINVNSRPGSSILRRNSSRRNRNAAVIGSTIVVKSDGQKQVADETDQGGSRVTKRKANRLMAEEQKEALRRSVSMGSDFFISELGRDEEDRKRAVIDTKTNPLLDDQSVKGTAEMSEERAKKDASPSPSSGSTASSPYSSIRNIPAGLVSDIRAEMDGLMSRIRALEEENKMLPALRDQVVSLEHDKQELQLDLENQGSIRQWTKGARKSMSSSLVSLQLLQEENRRIPDLQQKVSNLEEENRVLRQEKQLHTLLPEKAGVIELETKTMVKMIEIERLEAENQRLLEALRQKDHLSQSPADTRRYGDDEIRRKLHEKNKCLEQEVKRLQKKAADAALISQVADSAIIKWRELERQVKDLPKLRSQIAKLQEGKSRLETQVNLYQQQSHLQPVPPAMSPMTVSSPNLSVISSGSTSSMDSYSKPVGEGIQLKLIDENVKLKKVNEQLKSKCSGLAQSVNILKSQMEQQRQQLSEQLEGTRLELTVDKQQLEQETERLKQQNRRLLVEARSNKNAPADAIAKIKLLEMQTKNAQEQIEKQKEEVGKLKDRLTDSENEVADLRKISTGLNGFFARLSELQDACGLADVAVDNIGHATEVIEETHGQLQKLQSSCEMLRQDRDKLQFTCEAARAEVAIVQGKIHSYVGELASLEKRLQDSNRSLGSLRKQNEQLLVEKQELLETVRGLRVENGSLWQKSKELEEQKRTAEIELDKTARVLGVEERQGMEWKVKLNNSEDTITVLRDEVKALKWDKRELESRLKILETTNAEKHRLALELKEQEVIMSVQEKFQRQLQDVESVVEERQQALESHITYLEEMNEEKAKRCQELQTTLAAAKEHNGSLQQELRELNMRVQSCEDEVSAVQSQKEMLLKEREKFSHEKEEMQNSLDEQKSLLLSLQEARQQMQDNELKRQQLMAGLEAERDALRTELATTKDDKGEKDAELRSLQKLVDEKNSQVADKDEEIQKMCAEHEKKLREREGEAGIESNKHLQRIEQLQLRVANLQKELPAAELETQQLKETVDQLQLQLSTTETRLASEQHRTTELGEDLDLLCGQLEKEKTERDGIQAACKTAQEELIVLKTQMGTRDNQIDGLQHDYDVTCERLQQMETTKDELVKDKTTLEEQNHVMATKCEKLEKERDLLSEQCKESDLEFQQMTTSLYSVSSRVEELESIVADSTNVKAALEGRVDELTSQIRKAEQQASEQRELAAVLQERNGELMRRVQQYEDETLPKMKEETLLVEKEKLELENCISLMTTKLNGLEEQNEAFQKEVEDLRKARVEIDYEKDRFSRELSEQKGKEAEMVDKVRSYEKAIEASEKLVKQVQDAKAAAEEDVRSYKSRVVSLQLENEQAEDTANELQKERQRLQDELANLQESLKKSEEVEQNMRNSLEEAERYRKESEAQMSSLRENNKQLTENCSRLELLTESLEDAQQAYVSNMQASTKEVERLTAANTELTEHLQARPSSQSMLEDNAAVFDSDETQFLKSDNALLKDKVHHLLESVEQSREENRQIQLVIDEMEQSIPDITSKNKELQEQNKSLRQQIQLLSTRLKDVQELDQEKMQLEWKLQDMEHTLPMIQQQKEVSDVKAQEAEELSRRCQQLQYKVADLDDELSVQRLHAQQVPLLQEQCKFKQKEVKSLEGEIKIMGREIKELELEVAVWKQKTQQLKEDREMLLSDVNELKQANQRLSLLVDNDKQDHVERDAQDMASWQQVIAELERDNQQLQKQLDENSATQRRLEEENREMVHLNDLVLELEEENSKLQNKRDQDKKKMNELSQQIKESALLQDEAETKDQKMQRLTTEVGNLEAHVSELLKENEQLQSEVNGYRKSKGSEAVRRSTSPESAQRDSSVVLTLGTRVRELETLVAELQDELDQSHVQNGTDRKSLTGQKDTSPPRRLSRRLSFLPSPSDKGRGHPYVFFKLHYSLVQSSYTFAEILLLKLDLVHHYVTPVPFWFLCWMLVKSHIHQERFALCN